MINCEYCNEEFSPRAKHQRFCSPKCRVYASRDGMSAPIGNQPTAVTGDTADEKLEDLARGVNALLKADSFLKKVNGYTATLRALKHKDVTLRVARMVVAIDEADYYTIEEMKGREVVRAYNENTEGDDDAVGFGAFHPDINVCIFLPDDKLSK